MNAHVKIIVRTDFTKRDGTNPICLRVTIGKVKNISLNISVLPGSWDEKNRLVKKNYPDSYNINLTIENAIGRAKRILLDYTIQNKQITLGEFERIFNKPEFRGNSFYEFAAREIDNLKPKYSFYTIKTLNGHISKLKKYSPQLSFSDITLSFLKAYDNYMITDLKNKENTRAKAMAVIKSILNKALKEGLIKENVFKLFPIARKEGTREFLTSIELAILEKFYEETKDRAYRNALQCFLFSCYTGLRYQDIKNLKFCNLSDGLIKIVMHKTREQVTVPIIPQAKKLIGSGFPKQKVFKTYVNQYMNRTLKEIAKDATINKNISFHCARHTFATIGISSGIPIEVISKLLGHTDIQTTQIYAKIMNEVKVMYMEQWNSKGLMKIVS